MSLVLKVRSDDWKLDQHVLFEDGDAGHEEHDGTGAGAAPEGECWCPLEGGGGGAVEVRAREIGGVKGGGFEGSVCWSGWSCCANGV